MLRPTEPALRAAMKAQEGQKGIMGGQWGGFRGKKGKLVQGQMMTAVMKRGKMVAVAHSRSHSHSHSHCHMGTWLRGLLGHATMMPGIRSFGLAGRVRGKG